MNNQPFLALCALASQERWCWNLICGTCGHSHFRYAFKELICGKHPDKEGWVVNNRTRITRSVVKSLPSRGVLAEQDQEVLLQLVLEVSLEEIRAVSTFPAWLGYLGLVLTYCNNKNDQLSKMWAPQFLAMLPKNSYAHNVMTEIQRGHRHLDLNDLEIVERALLS